MLHTIGLPALAQDGCSCVRVYASCTKVIARYSRVNNLYVIELSDRWMHKTGPTPLNHRVAQSLSKCSDLCINVNDNIVMFYVMQSMRILEHIVAHFIFVICWCNCILQPPFQKHHWNAIDPSGVLGRFPGAIPWVEWTKPMIRCELIYLWAGSPNTKRSQAAGRFMGHHSDLTVNYDLF